MEINLNENIKIDAFEEALKNISDGFLIINKSENEYLQFAGTSDKLTVEIREVKANNLIRQYRIGKEPAENVWASLYTEVGEIRLKTSELLNFENAKLIFNSYIKDEKINRSFYKRNISKEIGLL